MFDDILLEHDHPENRKTEEAIALLKTLGFKEDSRNTGKVSIPGSLFIFTRE